MTWWTTTTKLTKVVSHRSSDGQNLMSLSGGERRPSRRRQSVISRTAGDSRQQGLTTVVLHKLTMATTVVVKPNPGPSYRIVTKGTTVVGVGVPPGWLAIRQQLRGGGSIS
ncbi:unnamed protein product [Soboliphyme baturini]|uniref:Uncharacterized protein n=1 Tax=Soboliphyme baturini TaxID=241478 RepID=A0A183J449_9BILA|nr:unnamed protein product [Soboliphyme baturini]